MWARHRLKDLAYVQELIRVLGSSEALADGMDPYVRQKHFELWQGMQGWGRRRGLLLSLIRLDTKGV